MESPLCQLVYASQSTFASSDPKSGIDLEVGRILGQSRRNNPRLGIGGVLYYGDGHFFQVLEGPRSAVQSLYDSIRQDPRHCNSTVLSHAMIKDRVFGDWSMKYIPADPAVKAQLRQYCHGRFDPFAFDQSMIERMVNLLNRSQSLDQPEPAPSPAPASGWRKIWSWLRLPGLDRGV
ncbi:BLUF domain-containing protein [Aestuariirhabdus litorea]|nr:BLUF domain-containing protein [Aestuariirhabdus litorea]